MAVFSFDQVDNYVQSEKGNINFFKLNDNGWQAKVRFMYGPGEIFQGYSVHKVEENGKQKFIPCLRELGQPLDVCPLCSAGVPTQAVFFIPLYVISITKCINNVLQPEEPINQVMVFQRGKTFKGSLESVIRQSKGTPIVSNVFNLVRNGKAGDTSTMYVVEHLGMDNTTLESLPERPEVFGSPILPNVSYEDMFKYVPQKLPSMVVPRQIPASPIQGGVQTQSGFGQPQQSFGQQAPIKPPF